jgi:hypothetical protein
MLIRMQPFCHVAKAGNKHTWNILMQRRAPQLDLQNTETRSDDKIRHIDCENSEAAS